MKKPDTLLGHLEAWVQEETGAQLRLLDLLERQEKAVSSKRSADMREAARKIEAELETRGARDRRRRDIFNAFARAWDVSANALTVGSIAERLGEHSERLVRMRTELASLTEEVRRMGRRATVLVRQNQSVLQEVIEFLVDQDGKDGADMGGRLVDAKA